MNFPLSILELLYIKMYVWDFTLLRKFETLSILDSWINTIFLEKGLEFSIYILIFYGSFTKFNKLIKLYMIDISTTLYEYVIIHYMHYQLKQFLPNKTYLNFHVVYDTTFLLFQRCICEVIVIRQMWLGLFNYNNQFPNDWIQLS